MIVRRSQSIVEEMQRHQANGARLCQYCLDYSDIISAIEAGIYLGLPKIRDIAFQSMLEVAEYLCHSSATSMPASLMRLLDSN